MKRLPGFHWQITFRENEMSDSMEKKNIYGWKLMHTYNELPPFFYTNQPPTPAKEPKLVLFNKALAAKLGLEQDKLESPIGAAYFTGSQLPTGADPIAQAYAGHQFGSFTRLGDGRAILLGEQQTPSGKSVDIQLKGAGRTAYSRGGDGRAALGPMLREYLISEAMHGLGIPTTRSLAVATTGEFVQRERPLTGAVLTRTAASHLRVGTFQYALVFGENEEIKQLADYAIKRHYPELIDVENKYIHFYEAVADRQAQLIAKWQLVGFIHGVMNTDNMTISGETIDYGPCAFMDTYHRNTVFSSIDREGRYAYVNQPYIGQWNLARFAETLLSLFAEDEDQAVQIAQDKLAAFNTQFKKYFTDGMRKKLGLFTVDEADEDLFQQLLYLMETYKADYTNTFLALTFNRLEGLALYQQADFKEWLEKWETRLEKEGKSAEEVQELMKANNPALIPRNYFVEEALAKAVNNQDYTAFNTLSKALENPYAHTCEQGAYANSPETSEYYQTYCGT